jgi:hypothetical protein
VPTYPFEPRSVAHLEAGQFWALPLSDGRFACGRVLAVPTEPDLYVPVSKRIFLAGLMGWIGDHVPDADGIAGARLFAQGFAHIKAIATTGGAILGIRPLGLDSVAPTLWRSHAAGGTVWIYQGATRLRHARPGDESLPIMSTWGYGVISLLAERLLVREG